MLWKHSPAARVPTAFSSFFKLFQTVMSVSVTQLKHRVHVFYLENIAIQKKNQLVYFYHQNINSLCLHHHYVNSSC